MRQEERKEAEVKIEDLPEKELTPDQEEAVKGGNTSAEVMVPPSYPGSVWDAAIEGFEDHYGLLP